MIRISNSSAGVAALGYALTPDNRIAWLDLAPEHPKRVEAIWAEMVDGGGGWLRITDEDPDRHQDPVITQQCRGLHHRYHRLTTEVPDLVIERSRPKMVRLIAPELCTIARIDEPFGVIGWPGVSPGTALAVELEHHTPLPIRLGWGDFLLAEAVRRDYAHPLIRGGTGPAGFWLESTPWDKIISDGVRAGHLRLDGTAQRAPIEIPRFEAAVAVA